MDHIKNLFKIDFIRVMTAVTVMGSFFIIVNALIFREIPGGNKEILIHVLGIVEGAVMTVVGYEFGSSKGTQLKDKPQIKDEDK